MISDSNPTWLLLLLVIGLLVLTGRPRPSRYRQVRIREVTNGWLPQYLKEGWFDRTKWVDGPPGKTYEDALDTVDVWHSEDIQGGGPR